MQRSMVPFQDVVDDAPPTYDGTLITVSRRVHDLEFRPSLDRARNPVQPARETRARTVRVRGLPAGDHEEVARLLEEFIREQLCTDELTPIITIIPSCNPKRVQKLEALLDFVLGLPRFLSKLEGKTTEGLPLKFKESYIEFDTHFLGFTQLYNVQPPSSASADVIAVCGISGHAYGSWRAQDESSQMWLRHLLEKDIPSFRVMIYGYHAKLSENNPAGGTLEQYTQNFLEELKRVRAGKEFQERPLFFVTHSFGGILVMKALVKARQEQDDGHPVIASLYKATYGLMFFAVPHGGIDFPNIIETLQENGHPLVSLLRDISTNSSLLKTLSRDFKNLIKQRKIVSFTEGGAEKPLVMNSRGELERSGSPHQALDSSRALLHLPESTETPVHSETKTHSSIAKLREFDKEYEAARDYFEEWEMAAAVHVKNEFSKPVWGPVPCDNIPYSKDPHFVPRDDILRPLENIFKSGGHRRAALIGFGGMGKSQVAIEFAHRRRIEAPNVWVFWIRAGDRPSFEHSYLEISRKQTGREIAKDEDVFVKVFDWLREVRNGHWLMVLDNADSVDYFFEPYEIRTPLASEPQSYPKRIIDFIPQVSHGAVLVTSRQRRSAFRIVNDNHNIIKVNPMSKTESIKLLRSRIPGSEVEEFYTLNERELVRHLDHVPLAISQAGAYIANSESSIDEYLEIFKTEATMIDDRETIRMIQQDESDLRREQNVHEDLLPDEAKKPHAVLYTWRISFRVIQRQQSKSLDLLSFIALYHCKGIPSYLLQDTMPEAAFEEALEPLLDFSFVTRAVNNDVAMHSLVQLATRNWLNLQSTIEQYRLAAIERMVKHFPAGTYETWAKCRQLYSHAEEVMLCQRDYEKCGLQYGQLNDRIGRYLRSRGDINMAAANAMCALRMKAKVVKEDDVEMLKSKLFYATVAGDVSNWRLAEDLQREVLEAIQSNPFDPRVMGLFPSTASDLVSSLSKQGFLEEAERMATVVHRVAQRTYSADSPSLHIVTMQLAKTHSQSGKWSEAEEILLKLVETERVQFHQEHPSLLQSRQSLATLYMSMKRFNEAEDILKEVSKGIEGVMGERHLDTLVCLGNYTTLLVAMKRDAEAEEMCNEVLRRSKGRLLQDHHLVLSMKDRLSTIYMRKEKWDEAEDLLHTIIKSMEQYQTPDSFDILHAKTRLAIFYNDKKEDKKAVELLRNLLKSPAAQFYPEHLTVLSIRRNLAIAIMNQGKFKKAIKLQQEVEAAYLKILGAEHPLTREARGEWQKWNDAYESLGSPWWPWGK